MIWDGFANLVTNDKHYFTVTIIQAMPTCINKHPYSGLYRIILIAKTDQFKIHIPQYNELQKQRS